MTAIRVLVGVAVLVIVTAAQATAQAVTAAQAVIGNMKLFERTGGYYLFWTGAVYLLFGLSLIGTDYAILAGPIWILVLTMPFAIPPFGRWLNMNVTWDKKMFNLFGKKKEESNVVDFPELKSVPKMPEVKPPKQEEPAKTFYRLGLTDNNRVSFQMGYSEITMNHEGCQQMIDQLTFFQSQLYDEDPTGGPDGGGGEPVPVPEQKAA